MSAGPLSFQSLDFSQTPFLVIWETTQACPLACRHCRAEAIPDRDPRELTTREGWDLLAQIYALGTPVCVLSGGDPLKRPDLTELVRYGAKLGLRMATIPAASVDLTRDKLVALKEAGLAQIAFSLDGSTAEIHDNFRRIPGTYDKTIQAVAWARQLEIPVQINTTVSRHTWHDIDDVINLVRKLGIVFWEVFSLVPVGRGQELNALSAEEHEELFAKLYALSKQVRFIIKVTEAPHFRRFILQQRQASGDTEGWRTHGSSHGHASAIPAQLSRDMSVGDSFGHAGKGINAGKGFCFISHTGQVFPSGFLPLPVGNVRNTPLAVLYRESDLLRQLRRPHDFHGRCGVCEFTDVCGGSRARAYAVTGDYRAEDPACAYQPAPR